MRKQPHSLKSKSIPSRHGITIREIAVCVAILVLLGSLAVPAIFSSRESARSAQCKQNIAQVCLAMRAYHDSFSSFPAAAIWKPGPLNSWALHATKRIDIVTYENWALRLLPFLKQESLAKRWNADLPIAAEENAQVRTTSLPQFLCPSDTFNRPDNPYQLSFEFSESPIEFARGNYGLNGGTHSPRLEGSKMAPNGDLPIFVMNEERGEFRWLGNGITGINWPLSFTDFRNGESTLVAFEELRAGIHPLDPRGVWAFGQPGGSMTWAHGVNGDAYGPNNQWSRSDDIQGCRELHNAVGTQTLLDLHMPCVDYVDFNQQATSRSQHAGGVHVAFVDGHTRFISDAIDPGLWHVLHSRETPADILSEESEEMLLAHTNDLREAPDPFPDAKSADEFPDSEFTNSLGMEFVRVPVGELIMGLPDVGFGPAPAECPAHPVKITTAFYLSRYEVTQKQFQEVMGRNPSHHSPETTGLESTDAFPVENLTWYDARDFCQRLAERAEEKSLGTRYRLPTEAEWEYACRAGEKDHRLPDSKTATSTGESAGIVQLLIGPVGRFKPNPFGLHDMRGNVWEWCADWFDRDYFARSSKNDPRGPATGYIKSVRGSDWGFVSQRCLVNLHILPPWHSQSAIGFRGIAIR